MPIHGIEDLPDEGVVGQTHVVQLNERLGHERGPVGPQITDLVPPWATHAHLVELPGAVDNNNKNK